ncbi:MAG: leucine-rich repeat protein [Clostridia bacterium]|nr:leucine-rich repeat protein [Clostridia bacterium]
MTKRSTKHSLLLSALSLLLCASMLIGTTFAWFTDSVTSTGNIIKSGTLEVTLEWLGRDADPTSDTAAWKNAADGAIFDYDRWEPGYTEVRHIKIENEGSLALKYQLNIVPSGELTEDGVKLADVIDVYYIDPAIKVEENDRSVFNDSNRLGTLTQALNGISATANGTLASGDKEIITLALKMQESAGNEYQGKTVGTDFAIQLLATQLDYESDSFDNTYDEGITYTNGALYRLDGTDLTLIEIGEDYDGSVLNVVEGCTVIGHSALAGNTTIETVILPSTVNVVDDFAFSQSKVSTVVLNEGLEKIGNRAFQKNTNLTSIVLPSTLTTIDAYAFQQTGLTDITIPESVTTINTGAFAYNNSLETIIINGNPVIGSGASTNYVARACKNLTSVYILGEPTYATAGMTFTNAETGNASGITFYVASQKAADDLIAASSASVSYGMNVVVMDAVDTNANIDDVLTTASDNSTVYLSAGEYTITKSNQLANNLTVICEDGVTIKVNDNWSGSYKGCLVGDGLTLINATVGDIVASNVSFIDCTFPYGFVGSEGNLNLTLTNCTVNGTLHFVEYGTNTTTITNTTANKAEYYSAGDVEFKGCTIGTLSPVNTDTVLTGCTVNEYDLDNIGSASLIVDGSNCVTNGNMLKSALTSGASDVSVIGEITLTEGFAPSNSTVTIKGITEDAAINFNGHNIAENNTITYKNLKLSTVSLPNDGTNGERYGWYGGIDYTRHAIANYENCTITGVFTLYSNTVNVDNCTFLPYVQDGEEFYHIFQYGTSVANIKNSTFYYGDRAIKIYNEGGTKDVTMNVIGCTFKPAENYTLNKVLINIDPSALNSVTLNVEGINVDSALSSLNIYNENSKTTVTIN